MANPPEFNILKAMELPPVPTMGSDDEESFVILGKSIGSDIDVSIKNLSLEPILSGPVEEAEKLINMELSRLDEPPEPANEQGPPFISAISLSPDEVQQKLDGLINENIKLRETIIKNNSAMESQHTKIVVWKEEVQKTHQSHKQKFAEAKEFISKLKAEKEFLTAELAKCNEIKDLYEKEVLALKDGQKVGNKSESSQVTPDTSMQKEELLAATRKIGELNRMLVTLTLSNSELVNENKTLKSKTSNADSDKDKEQLTKVVEEQTKLIENLNKKIIETQQSAQAVIQKMNTEIIDLRSRLCLTVNLQEDLDNARKQLMNSQSSIISLEHKNSNLMAQLAAQQKNQRQPDLVSMRDDYFALQQQVELYKADFEAERRAKEMFIAEKDQVIKDFLQIQKRNNELNEEIELLKERGFEVVHSGRSRRSESSTHSSGASNASTQGRLFNCPICNFGFTAYQALENHVERCMDLSTSLP